MITAEEARKLSYEDITNQLQDYINNCVDPAIKKAAAIGDFHTTVGFKDVRNYQIIAKETVKALKQAGFDAKHVYNCNCDPREYENHIYISWDKEGVTR